jgi:predicted DNA-binding WGR domain protein
MREIYLRRIDPEQNVQRFYALKVERNLFGEVVLVREWGRIGGRGRTMATEHPDEAAAEQALEALQASKIRRGYDTAGS